MKTKIGRSFGLALLLALGVLAAMLALGMFTAPKVQAAAQQMDALDPGGRSLTIIVTADPSGAFQGTVLADPLITVAGSGYVPGTSVTIHYFYDPMNESPGNVTVTISQYAVAPDPYTTFMDVSETKAAFTGWRMTTSTQRTSGGQVGMTPQLVLY